MDIGSWNVDMFLYSMYFFVLDMWKGGIVYGVLFLNFNGMDVEYKKGDLFIFRVIGGVFDFYFFVGLLLMVVVD